MPTFHDRLDLLYVLSKTQLKIRYKNAALGYVWSLANPLAFAGAFYFIFQVVMNANRPDMTAFLVTGLFPWQWVSNSIGQGTMVFIANAALVKRVAFPRHMLALSLVLQDGWHFLFSVPVIIAVLIANDHWPSWTWIVGIPAILAVQALMLYGIVLIVGCINMFLRDIEHLVSVLLMLLFYGTPIVYDAAQIPEGYKWIAMVNPFAWLISVWRDLLLEGRIEADMMLSTLAIAMAFVTLGAFCYRKLSPRFAELV